MMPSSGTLPFPILAPVISLVEQPRTIGLKMTCANKFFNAFVEDAGGFQTQRIKIHTINLLSYPCRL